MLYLIPGWFICPGLLQNVYYYIHLYFSRFFIHICSKQPEKTCPYFKPNDRVNRHKLYDPSITPDVQQSVLKCCRMCRRKQTLSDDDLHQWMSMNKDLRSATMKIIQTREQHEDIKKKRSVLFDARLSVASLVVPQNDRVKVRKNNTMVRVFINILVHTGSRNSVNACRKRIRRFENKNERSQIKLQPN
jgi:hypothetical protein